MLMKNKMKIKENERIDDLQINNLKIIQNKNGFCFGIDSVLLSDFASDIKKDTTVLDLGTGTGIISILLSAKTSIKNIIGIEIQENVAEMAKRSVELNNLQNKIKIMNADIKELIKILPNNRYDAIVTNPPYMKKNSGLENENREKLISRHEIECTIYDISRVSNTLLKDKGEVYMVHRPDRLIDIVEAFRKNKLEIKKIRLIHPKMNMPANLVLIKAVKNGNAFLQIDRPLYVYNEDGSYTSEIKKIYNKE